MTAIHLRTPGRFLRLASRALPAGALVFSACNLDVTTPDVVQPSSTQGAAALPTLLAGTVGDFAVAYSGYGSGNAGEGIVLNSGLFADEFITADYFNTHVEIDGRNLTPPNSSNEGVLRNLMRARTSAEATAAAYAGAGQGNNAGRARALSLAGYVYTLVAETYCSGVPFSSIDANGVKIFGLPLRTSEMLAAAVAKFDSAGAVAATSGNNQQRYLAQIGKARALLAGGQVAAAAAAVTGVPRDFNFSTEQGSVDDRTKSGIHQLTFIDTRYTVADREGGKGLAFVSAGDERVQTEALGTSAFDGTTDLFAPLKYSSYSAPTPIATGIEAQLIRAEAALRAGNYLQALALLNALRAPGDELVPQATPRAQEDQLFRERAFWLFGTAHRLGDLRRLVTQYGRAATSVYPAGVFAKGDVYGSHVALLVPKDEEQNPSFVRASCDPTKP